MGDDEESGPAQAESRSRPVVRVAPFLISLGLGLTVGAFYGLVRFNSPAPPPVALVGLVGLAGIVIGQWLVQLLLRR